MVLATYDSGFYKFFLILHILSAIVGFGAVVLNGIYGQQMKTRMQSGKVSEALAIYDANFFVSGVGQFFIYGVFVFGFVTALLGDPLVKFDQTWLWLAMVLYIVALGISHGLLLPAVKRMGVLMREVAAGPPPVGGPPPQATEMASLGQRIGAAGLVLNLFIVVILFLMVWKPGL
jgi:hypothetical protein